MEYSGPTDLYIDGEWTAASSGETIDTEDPATEETYATVEKADETDVDAAVAAAGDAAAHESEWRTMDPDVRGQYMHAMADAIEEMKDEISMVESHDNGKTPFEAGLEIDLVVDTFRYYAGWSDKVEGEQIPVSDSRLN